MSHPRLCFFLSFAHSFPPLHPPLSHTFLHSSLFTCHPFPHFTPSTYKKTKSHLAVHFLTSTTTATTLHTIRTAPLFFLSRKHTHSPFLSLHTHIISRRVTPQGVQLCASTKSGSQSSTKKKQATSATPPSHHTTPNNDPPKAVRFYQGNADLGKPSIPA